MSLTELSLRWARQRSALTTTLLGVASMSQLEEDLGYYRKMEPLPRELMWEIDRVHMRNRLPIFASTKVTPNPNPILTLALTQDRTSTCLLLASAKVTTGCSQSAPNPNRKPWP